MTLAALLVSVILHYDYLLPPLIYEYLGIAVCLSYIPRSLFLVAKVLASKAYLIKYPMKDWVLVIESVSKVSSFDIEASCPQIVACLRGWIPWR